MKSYTNRHAKLASQGINILNIVPIKEGMTAVLFEYCWHDSSAPNKLHWSKSYILINKDSGDVVDTIISRVNDAREELGYGV